MKRYLYLRILSFLILFGFGTILFGEAQSFTFDFQKNFDLPLTKSISEKEPTVENITGTLMNLRQLKGQEITLEADIYFKTIRNYSLIEISLQGAEKEELLMHFSRGDVEFLPKYGSIIPGARGKFHFKNSEGKPVHVTAPLSFNTETRYLVRMKYDKDTNFSVIVHQQKKDEKEFAEVWDSGPLKIIGSALFDKAVVKLYPSPESTIIWDKEKSGALLKSMRQYPKYYMEAILNHITIKNKK